ncbi:MAG: ABC transporter ATP-binding protein [Candidatus Protochlamydia sp.]|nr:ABC transporter ATP-binding protein [Candidatus Protochlamydia sp.]
MNHPLLTVKDLHLSFKDLFVLNGVDFQINAGETVGLIGESGSGKSLTAFATMRLLPLSAQVSQGSIFFQGKNLFSLSDKEMRKIRGKKIGLIFQDPSLALNPTKKLGKQLTEGMRLHLGLARGQAWQQGVEWLRKVGLSEPSLRMEQYPHEISGGMKQRVAIAMTLACHPDLLIADEPTSALDVTIQAQILELLKELQQEHQMALLLITHDLGVAAQCCDRLLVMYAGQIVESGTTAQILHAPTHSYTQALIRARENLYLKGKK